MIKLLTIILTLFISNFALAETANCKSILQKLKPSCNIVGAGAKKLKKLSEDNKTVGDTLGNAGIIKKKSKGEEKLTLKELSNKHKTINDTIKTLKKK